ncbi:MAG: hypothetical protein L6R39_002008 [Caloplaca ligustica]|nr:MAG: hypothetical protein L6R39_002008 [Caloplaca ligustica]
MPPFIGVKRRRSASPLRDVGILKKPAKEPPKKQTLFDAADQRPAGSLQANEQFVDALAPSDSSTLLSDVSSVEFEDVRPQSTTKKPKHEHPHEDDEEIDWEDAVHNSQTNGQPLTAAQPSGDLELTLGKGSGPSFVNNQRKGPSKIERQIRVATHCMHVQFLLFHNSIRSRWACDKEVQKILVDQLSPTAKKEIATWKLASGQLRDVTMKAPPGASRPGKDKRGPVRKNEDVRNQRDWGKPAERQEVGVANTSRGDPAYRLLKFLSAYWRKRFTVTAPGLRKQGYKSLTRLEEEILSFKNDKHDPEEHGERIANLGEFRECARRCEGSRDIGVQLFVALLRGLGLEVRLVASLQPLGFGWNKIEGASPKKKRTKKVERQKDEVDSDIEMRFPDSSSELKKKELRNIPIEKPSKTFIQKGSTVNGSKNTPISFSNSDSSELSSVADDDRGSDDDESVVEITPSTTRRRPNMPYDRDMVSPIYWAEVISPITSTIYPCDPFILTPSIATKPEHLDLFSPRGSRAEKSKQAFAYIVAYSPDGTAKDVTTRYLKHHRWPGRTKGFRLPVEKIPVYNSKGKIKHHEEYDWFKRVMSGYVRPDHMRTAADDIEDATDLKPVRPEKKDAGKEKEGTLQFYKTSAEYVLERHLRREEAIVPGAQPVRYFTAGKGEEKKDEPVFLRKDVLICRTGESWHKEGRQIKPGQVPLKMVPIRAVTLTRKREVEEAERDGGEKLKQGLYAWDQTDWIIPAPIVGGVIPKNAYGNIDAFVPTMVPEGAAHIPLKSTSKICKRLGIDFAEAVTGFEFGKQRAVPVIQGVVVAKENEEIVLAEWDKDEEERRIKEEGKREKVALAMWKKFVVGLRIVQRVKGVYGEEGGREREERNPFTNRMREGKRHSKEKESVTEMGVESDEGEIAGGFLPNGIDGSDAGGGFLPEGYEDNTSPPPSTDVSKPVQRPNGLYLNPPPKQDSPDPEDDEAPVNEDTPPEKPKKGRGRPQKLDGTRTRPRSKPDSPDPYDDHQQPIYNLPSPPIPPNARSRRKSVQVPDKGRRSQPKEDIQEDSSEPEPPEPEPSMERPRRSTNRQLNITTTPPVRAAPQRRSARQGEKVVRSRYFEQGSDEEDDE